MKTPMHTREATDEEALIRAAIDQAALPDFVDRVELELDEDSTGAPAVWLYVIVTDKEAGSRQFFKHAEQVRESLERGLRSAGSSRWPYIRFRSASEHKALALEPY